MNIKQTVELAFEIAWADIPWLVRTFGSRKQVAKVLYAQGRIDGAQSLGESLERATGR